MQPGPPNTKAVDASAESVPKDSGLIIAALRRHEMELSRANRALRTLSSCNQSLIHASTEAALLADICGVIVEKGGYKLAWVGYAMNDGRKTVRPVAHAGFEAGYLEKVGITWADEPRGRGPTGSAIRTRQPAICRDVQTDPKFEPWREDAIKRGYASSIVLPLQAGDKVLGAVNIYAAERDSFDGEEVNLLRELADDLAYGIMALRTRDEHKRAEEALRQKEALFNSLISTIPDHLYFKDRQSRFVRINDLMARDFGLPDAAQAVGKTDFDFFGEEHARQAYADEQQMMTTGVPIIALEEKETWPDGRITWASSTKVPLRDPAGQITGLVGISREITRRKLLETQVLRAQRMDAFGQLAGGVAHDFNNILAAFLMQINLLQLEPSLSPEVAAGLAEMERHAKRGASLTRQLLLFSRRQEMEIRTVDLNLVLDGLATMLARLLGEDIAFEYRKTNTALWIEADAGMIEQVVMNLCVNARDAMPDGGCLTVQTMLEERNSPTEPAGQYVCLRVTDTGCGMDEATKAKIFEPFFTTKPVGKGTGIGLATVYGIVKQHQGWVEVDSAPNCGSTFRVYFPFQSRLRKAAESAVIPAEVAGGKESIMLVEDEESLRLAMAACLRHVGYTIVDAADGPEALRKWAEGRGEFDLLLTDFLMPGGLTGLQLALQLRRAKEHLRVLVVSGHIRSAKEAGPPWPEEFMRLTKPFEMRILLKAVRQCLDAK